MSQQRKAPVVVLWLFCALLIYAASYFWLLHTHTVYWPGGIMSVTTFATGTADSALLVLFYPAVCVNAAFDKERAFNLTDAKSNWLPGRHIYPFGEVRVFYDPCFAHTLSDSVAGRLIQC